MIKVIERRTQKAEQSFDSLIIEIPQDFAVSHGLPENSLAALTVQNGKIVSEIIPYSENDENEVKKFLADFPDFDAEMKKLGD